MSYTIIQDFRTIYKGREKSIVKFFVKDEEPEGEKTCTVSADIPNDALKYDMIKIGAAIRWGATKVYIEIEGVSDIPFNKVSTLATNKATFVKT
jgi:hypothetical protein